MKHVSTSATTTMTGREIGLHNIPRDVSDAIFNESIAGPSMIELQSGGDFTRVENHALGALENERRFKAFYVDEAHLSAGPRPYQREMMDRIRTSCEPLTFTLNRWSTSLSSLSKQFEHLTKAWMWHGLRYGTPMQMVGCSSGKSTSLYPGPHVDAHRGHVSALHIARTLVDAGPFSRPSPYLIHDEVIYGELARHPDVVAAFERVDPSTIQPMKHGRVLPGRLSRHYTTEKLK